MALINEVIGKDYFQLCRDNIASILLLELPNQSTLQDNEDLNFTKIWRDRKRLFNASEIPAINLSIESVNYGVKNRVQREANPIFNIDIYDSKVSTEDADADELLSESTWQIARTIQYILDNPVYATLGLSPYVMHTEVSSIESGEAVTSEDNRCSILRIKFTVKTMSILQGATPIPYSQLTTVAKLEQTEKGFIYQIIND